ncbi:MAG TPA: hypothetical protein VK206_25995 [Anaerolineales bacterium]|nr:hypothetical protein [Anaerolineales bacterium]HLO30998.1 hypothetical protein [Anaerolineales bacterium]
MKTSPYFLLIVNAFLAIGLTVISFQYVQPKNCYNFCDPSYVIPCSKGSCYFGDQKAGWPIPVIVDSPGGGSPTDGWGVLGNEDLPHPIWMIADVLFYSILVWIVLYVIQYFRHQAFSPKLFLRSLPLNVFLGASLWFFYLIFIPTLSVQVIGRGHRESLYVKTSKDIDLHTAMAFAPRDSIPLDEVVAYYGEPDYVWFTSDPTTEGRTTGLLLDWDSVNIFVELPQIADKTYTVHRKTGIERIIFSDDQDVISVAGRQLSEEKTAWRGYGNYQP